MIFVICNRIKHSLGLLVTLAAGGILAGCGFHLQGTNGELPTATAQTYLQTDDPYSDFYDSLRQALRERGAGVVESPQDASAVLRIIEDSYGQRILSVSARNVPREYEVFYTVTFSLEAGGSELLAPESMLVTRSYTWDETRVLGKSAEENALRQSLARDLALRVLRRIAADRQSVPAT
jgi:LPS-assembly lipoprotein